MTSFTGAEDGGFETVSIVQHAQCVPATAVQVSREAVYRQQLCR